MDSGGEENARCRICPSKCSWQNHVNNPYYFEIYQEKEEKISEDLQKKYQTAVQGKNKVESILEQINNFLLKVEEDVIAKVNEVQRALQHLDKIALRFKSNPLTQLQHLDMLIESEKQNAQPGYQNRIKMYEQAKKEAETLEAATNNSQKLHILTTERKKKMDKPKKQSYHEGKAWYKYW